MIVGLTAAILWTPVAGLGARTRTVWVLNVTDESGKSVWSADVDDGDEVVLEYTNSIYGAPTWEHLIVRGGAFHLNKVSSTREAVLEYHRLAPPYRVENGRLTKKVSAPALQALKLRVGETGRPVLHVGSQIFPLYTAGVGASLTAMLDRAKRYR